MLDCSLQEQGRKGGTAPVSLALRFPRQYLLTINNQLALAERHSFCGSLPLLLRSPRYELEVVQARVQELMRRSPKHIGAFAANIATRMTREIHNARCDR
jgi:hypothetical protein